MWNKKSDKTYIIDFVKKLEPTFCIPEWVFGIQNSDRQFHQEKKNHGNEKQFGNIKNPVKHEELWPHTQFYKSLEKRFVWKPLSLENGQKDYRVYYSIVNRLDYLEKLNIQFRYKKEPSKSHSKPFLEFEKRIRSIQDSYMYLILHMVTKNQFRDSQLLNCSNEISALEMYSPFEGDHKSFTVEDLPNLTSIAYNCNFWSDNVENPFLTGLDKNVDTVVDKIRAIFNKAIPKPCGTRLITTSTVKGWMKEGHVDIFRCIHRMTLASLLGVYDHCTEIPDFDARYKIYQYFAFIPPNPKQFGDWVAQNKLMWIYMIREYVFWTIKFLPELDSYLSSRYYYKSVVSNVFNAMDVIRKTFSRNVFESINCIDRTDDMNNSMHDFFLNESPYHEGSTFLTSRRKFVAGKSWFSFCNSYLEQINKANPNNWPRVKNEPFIDKFSKILDAIELEFFYTGKVESPDISLEIQVLDGILSRIPQSDPVGYEFLAIHFGVDETFIQKLREAEIYYEYETERSEFPKLANILLCKGKRDFLITTYFFRSLRKRNAIHVYTLPAEIANIQIKNFRKLFKIEDPEKPLPEEAGRYYICMSCGNLKSSVMTYNSGSTLNEEEKKYRSKAARAALRSSGIILNIENGHIYCNPTKTKNRNKSKKDISLQSVTKNKKRSNFENSNDDDEDDDDDDDTNSSSTPILSEYTSLFNDTHEQIVNLNKSSRPNHDFFSDEEDKDEEDEDEDEDEDEEDNDEDEEDENEDEDEDDEDEDGQSQNDKEESDGINFSNEFSTVRVENKKIENIVNKKKNESEEKKKAKYNKKQQQNCQCKTSPVNQVFMIGHAINIKNKMTVLLCPHCLTPTRLSRRNFQGLGGHLSCGCKQDEPEPIVCLVCFRVETKNEKFSMRRIFIDESPDPIICSVPLCNKQSCSAWVRNWSADILPLSSIERAREENLYTSKIGNVVFFRKQNQNVGPYKALKLALSNEAFEKRKNKQQIKNGKDNDIDEKQ